MCPTASSARSATTCTAAARRSATTTRWSGSSRRRTTYGRSRKKPVGEPQPKAAQVTRGLMALFAATMVAGAGTIHYQTPMLGAMAVEFGASPAEIGWVPTLTFGGFLAGILFLVPLGDRLDKRR